MSLKVMHWGIGFNWVSSVFSQWAFAAAQRRQGLPRWKIVGAQPMMPTINQYSSPLATATTSMGIKVARFCHNSRNLSSALCDAYALAWCVVWRSMAMAAPQGSVWFDGRREGQGLQNQDYAHFGIPSSHTLDRYPGGILTPKLKDYRAVLHNSC